MELLWLFLKESRGINKKMKTEINFTCLKEKCPNSCCGPFKGMEEHLVSLFGLKLCDIPLITKETVKVIKKLGKQDKIFFHKELKIWFIKLNEDKSCPFWKNGLCEIYFKKPLVCSAYPFYIDLFAGICVDKSCPGIGGGR